MSELSGLYAIWYRELKVFFREKSRIIGSIIQPLLWIVVFGAGLGAAVNIQGINYQNFIYPGILAMTLIFTSIFYGTYIVWDRKLDFLKEVLVAPVSRTTIFFGKVLGGCTDSLLQVAILLLLGFVLAIPLTPYSILSSILIILLMAIGLVSVGLVLGSVMSSFEGFNLIVSFLIFPLFFLSGALFPIDNLPGWLHAFTRVDPITYGVDALRGVILGLHEFPLVLDLGVLLAFDLVFIVVGTIAFQKMKL